MLGNMCSGGGPPSCAASPATWTRLRHSYIATLRCNTQDESSGSGMMCMLSEWSSLLHIAPPPRLYLLALHDIFCCAAGGRVECCDGQRAGGSSGVA